MILTGSYRDSNALELYDLRTMKKMCDIDTKTKSGSNLNYISSCSFGTNAGKENFIIAGSCMANMVGIFKKDLVF